jgi:hypothetical protein
VTQNVALLATVAGIDASDDKDNARCGEVEQLVENVVISWCWIEVELDLAGGVLSGVFRVVGPV